MSSIRLSDPDNVCYFFLGQLERLDNSGMNHQCSAVSGVNPVILPVGEGLNIPLFGGDECSSRIVMLPECESSNQPPVLGFARDVPSPAEVCLFPPTASLLLYGSSLGNAHDVVFPESICQLPP
jgi:hypothetical protein